MTYILRYRQGLREEILKYLRNDPVRFEQLARKIECITEYPENGKPLCNQLKGKWGVHIGPCVLIYKIEHQEHCVVLLKIRHHDEVYS
jgi:mRNA-degrading endonuclease RelE of RelBE toxin-antitoxin system